MKIVFNTFTGEFDYVSEGSGPSGDDLHVARFIVSPGGGADGANYTSIASAYAAAIAKGGAQTVFVQPGTYTENITLHAGIDIASFWADADTPNVIINGKLSASFAGSVSISGVSLQTNSDYAVEITGSSATNVFLTGCYLNCLNNTGLHFASSSSSANLRVNYCLGNIATTGIALFAHSSAGALRLRYCDITNSGLSTTSNTISSGSVNLDWSVIRNPFTTSSTGGITLNTSTINTSAVNSICITHDGSGNSACTQSYFLSGSASAISIASPDGIIVTESTINSSNTNALTGTGTIQYGSLTFLSSSGINTSTQTTVVSRAGTLQLFNALGATYGGTGLNSTGTSGNVLTSTGSLWVSQAPALMNVTGTLTSSQIKNLHGSPISLIAAQGSGKLIQIVNALFKMNYGGNNVFVAGASQTLVLSLGSAGPSVSIVTSLANANIVASQNTLDFSIAAATNGNASTTANTALWVYNPVATEISGNAANDNTITYNITYYVL